MCTVYIELFNAKGFKLLGLRKVKVVHCHSSCILCIPPMPTLERYSILPSEDAYWIELMLFHHIVTSGRWSPSRTWSVQKQHFFHPPYIFTGCWISMWLWCSKLGAYVCYRYVWLNTLNNSCFLTNIEMDDFPGVFLPACNVHAFPCIQ